ncbi:hypothetical protein LEMLEM_LOCUS27431 [Lemmus lemmus]
MYPLEQGPTGAWNHTSWTSWISVPETRPPPLHSHFLSPPQTCPRSRCQGWKKKKRHMDGWTLAAAVLRKGTCVTSDNLPEPNHLQPCPAQSLQNIKNKLASGVSPSHVVCLTREGLRQRTTE